MDWELTSVSRGSHDDLHDLHDSLAQLAWLAGSRFVKTRYAGTFMKCQIVLNTLENIYLNEATPCKTLQFKQ